MLPEVFARIKKDSHFRIKAFLRASMLLNVAYAIFLFVTARIYDSEWFLVMAAYYALLSVARGFVFAQINAKRGSHAKIVTQIICGCFLLLINVVVSVMMFILMGGSNSIKHHEIIVITLATYTFTSLTFAIIGSIRHLKQGNRVYFCAKIISLTSASVSLVTLTNTMLITFGQEQILLRSIILPILCAAVAIFIIVCAVLMIVKANIELKRLRNE